jgi:hypothetical protein
MGQETQWTGKATKYSRLRVPGSLALASQENGRYKPVQITCASKKTSYKSGEHLRSVLFRALDWNLHIISDDLGRSYVLLLIGFRRMPH